MTGARRLSLALAAVAALLVVACGAALTPSARAAQLQGDDIVEAAIEPDAPGQEIARSFLGLSIETWGLTDFAGGIGPDGSAPVDPIFAQLMRNLGGHGSGRAWLRIGGNSTDASWWNPRGRAPKGIVKYSIGPGWMRKVAAIVKAIRGRAMFGLSMGPAEPDNARYMARAALRYVERGRISGFEIGNEPDLFDTKETRRVRTPPYKMDRYMRELNRYIRAVRRVVPRTKPIGGPVSALHRKWSLARFMQREANKVADITTHRYALTRCGKHVGDADYPTIARLLSQDTMDRTGNVLHSLVRQAHAHGLPVDVTELNSISCSGAADVSDTFAATLWTADAAFEAASIGIRRVYFHTGTHSHYRPFAYDDGRDSPDGHAVPGLPRIWSVHAPYYGMLLVSRALAHGAELIPVDAKTAGNIRVWATREKGGTIHFVVLNKDPFASGTVSLWLPGHTATGTLGRLQAPSLASTTGVTIDGQTYGATTTDGKLHGAERTEAVPATADGHYLFKMPAGSAAMLTVAP